MHEVNPDKQLWEFITRCGINVDSDRPSRSFWTPTISAVERIVIGGSDYHFTQLDYCDGDEVKASRMVAEILPGNSTELAWWSEDAPRKTLDIHKGRCEMV